VHYIDLESWARRDHFYAFKTWGYPHFNLCANVDVTPLYPFTKQRGISFNLAVVFVITQAANEIREFKYRIRGNGVVEYEIVHPAITIMVKDDLFSFCVLEFDEDFTEFCTRALKQMDDVRRQPSLSNDPERDNLFYTTAIPWVSFTSITHPLDLDHMDSVPRFAWGKFFKDGDTLKMPLSVQAHHALVDGVHAGQFFEKVQILFDQPCLTLGSI
jgi:chloramphenicol O-acetyltransferase type A